MRHNALQSVAENMKRRHYHCHNITKRGNVWQFNGLNNVFNVQCFRRHNIFNGLNNNVTKNITNDTSNTIISPKSVINANKYFVSHRI